jgi:hypothetical protein
MSMINATLFMLALSRVAIFSFVAEDTGKLTRLYIQANVAAHVNGDRAFVCYFGYMHPVLVEAVAGMILVLIGSNKTNITEWAWQSGSSDNEIFSRKGRRKLNRFASFLFNDRGLN